MFILLSLKILILEVYLVYRNNFHHFVSIRMESSSFSFLLL